MKYFRLPPGSRPIPHSFPALPALLVALCLLPLFLTAATAADTFSLTGGMSTPRRGHTAVRLADARVVVAGGLNQDGTLGSAEVYDPATGVWTATGPLKVPRSGHTAVLLRTGKVLINGGRSADGAALASAELYDPATGTWTFTGSMETARRHHTATMMQHGTVMVVGGSADDDGAVSFDTTEIYNPATGAWTNGGLITQARSFHTATAIGSLVYIVGGISDGVYSTVLEYHQLYLNQIMEGRWQVAGMGSGSSERARKFHTATPMPNYEVLVTGGVRNVTLSTARLIEGYNQPVPGSLSVARSEHTATMLPDGRVLAAGGLNSAGAAIAEAETYTKASGKWIATGGMKAARAGHTATLLPGGRVLFTGGYNADGALSSCELYTAAATPWAETAPLNLGRERPTSTLLPDGGVLVAGGAAQSYAAVGDAQLYDPVGDIWSSVPGFSARASHSAVLLPDGRVMIAGGYTDWDGLIMTNTTALFDPASRSWIPSGNLLAKRSSHAAVLLPNGKVLLAGGYFRTNYEDGTGLAGAEIYDPVTGVCRAAAPMSMARTGPRATLLADGRVLVMGGNDGSDATASRSAEIYDPAADAWSSAGTLLYAHGGGTATLLLDGKVLVTGGLDDNDKNAKGVAEIYDPATNTWRGAAPMLTEGLAQSAVLLHDGKVLVTGSYHYENAGSPGGHAEIYDPVTDSWSLAGSCRSVYHGTSMLLDGRVLLAGGRTNGAEWASFRTQTFDPGFAFRDAPRPVITSVAFDENGRLVVAGSGFAGTAPGAAPVVKLRRLNGEKTVSLPADPVAGWTATSFTSSPVTGFPLGHAMVTVLVNGVPSVSSVVSVPAPELRVERAGTGAELAGGAAVDFGSAKPGENTELSFVIQNTGAMPLGGLAVTFSGPDAARFSLVQAPAETVPAQGGSTSFTVRFAPDSPGLKTAALHLAGTDPDRNPFTLALTGQGLNTAPVVTGLTDAVIDEDGQAVLTLTVTDAETPNGFTLSASSSNPALLPVSGIAFSGTGPERTVTFTPLPDRSGSVTVTVTANDGALQSAPVSLTLTVHPVNDSPTLDNIGPVTVHEDSGARTVSLTGLGSGPEESGQALTITAISSHPALIPDPAVSHDGASATGTLTFTPAPDATGTATVTVRVTDGQALNDTLTRSFVVTVLPVNDPPTLDVIPDPAPIPEDSGAVTVNLTGLGAGPGESGQTLTVMAISSHPALIPDPVISHTSPAATGTLTLTPTPDASGTAVITVTVSDGQSAHATVSRSFTVTVTPVNDPPTLAAIAAPAALRENGGTQRVEFHDVSAGAGDAEAVTITAVSSNPGLIPHPVVYYSPFPSSGYLEFTPAPDRSGTAVITVTVDDGQGGPGSTVSQSFTVRVLPLLRGEAAAEVSEGNEGATPLRFRIFVSDPQPEAVTVNYTTASGTAQAGSDFTAASGTAVIATGQTEAFVDVEIRGDTDFEADETVDLALSTPVGSFLQNATLTGIIKNDDAQPALALTPGSVTEGASGGPFQVWVKASLAAPSTLPLSWTVATRAGTAVEGADFKPLGPATLTFAPGETVKWAVVEVTGAGEGESGDEEFYLDFTPRSGPATVVSAPCVIRQLTVREFIPLGQGVYALRFPTGTGQSYAIEEADAFAGPWVPTSSILIGSGSIVTQVVYSDKPRVFFRVKAAPWTPGAVAVGP